MELKQYIGHTFNHLTVKSELERIGNRRFFWCVCICGNERRGRLDDLKNNQTSSCGCQTKIKKIKVGDPNMYHGMANKHPLYVVWKNMRSRCYNKNNKRFKDYGGRGILMCEEWHASFKPFYEWALKNGWEVGLEIDREDNDSGYSPENCRCVTSAINNRNKRTNILYNFRGKQLTLPDIAKLAGVGFSGLYRRLNVLNMPLDIAIEIPSARDNNPKTRKLIKSSCK